MSEIAIEEEKIRAELDAKQADRKDVRGLLWSRCRCSSASPALFCAGLCVCWGLVPWFLTVPLVAQAAERARIVRELELAKEQDALQRARDENLVRMQEESAKRQEVARLESERALQAAQLDHDAQMQQAKLAAETEGRLRFEVCVDVVLVAVLVAMWVRLCVSARQRETEDVATRKLLAQSKADQEKWIAATLVAFEQLGIGAKALLTDYLGEVVGGTIALALGVYAAREGVVLLRTELPRYLGMPKLVRESSKKSSVGSALRTLLTCGCCRGSKAIDAFADVYLEKNLMAGLKTLATSTR